MTPKRHKLSARVFLGAGIYGVVALLPQYFLEEKPTFVADMGSYDLWLASFRDSENNLLALMGHLPKGT